MSQTQTNSLKPTSLHPQPSSSSYSSSASSSSSNPSKQNMYKPITIAKTEPEKVAAFLPVEIGTRGTVGSLVLKEIEYFDQLELGGLGRQVNSKTMAQSRVKDMACSSSTSSHSSKHNFGSLSATQKKKKRGSKLLPSMCSMVEVSKNNKSIGILGFSYRNLKTDVKNLQA